jgi:hypothetical protein
VRSISLTHAKPPLTSDAPTWRYTDHAGAMVGTRPENIRGWARRERGWPWEHGGSGGDTRHPGGAALDQCGARAHRPWRARIQGPWPSRPWAWKAAGLHQPAHRRPLRSILEAILGTLPLSTGSDRTTSTCLCPAPATDRCRASAAIMLVLLRRVPSLLPVCPTVPRGMEAGNPHTTISPRL